VNRMAHPESLDRGWTMAFLVAAAAMDGATVGILLVGSPLPPAPEFLAAAITHGISVLFLVGPGRPSRRWLGCASLLAVPLAGAAVAAASVLTRGRGSAMIARRRRVQRPPVVTRAAIRRLGSALSHWDALACGDAEQRHAALAALARRADPEAIALLRRAAAGRDPDLALSAALTLDEIGERSERSLDRRDSAEVRHGTG